MLKQLIKLKSSLIFLFLKTPLGCKLLTEISFGSFKHCYIKWQRIAASRVTGIYFFTPARSTINQYINNFQEPTVRNLSPRLKEIDSKKRSFFCCVFLSVVLVHYLLLSRACSLQRNSYIRYCAPKPGQRPIWKVA